MGGELSWLHRLYLRSSSTLQALIRVWTRTHSPSTPPDTAPGPEQLLKRAPTNTLQYQHQFLCQQTPTARVDNILRNLHATSFAAEADISKQRQLSKVSEESTSQTVYLTRVVLPPTTMVSPIPFEVTHSSSRLTRLQRQAIENANAPSLLPSRPSQRTQQCSCCYEDKQQNEFPTSTPTKFCEHDVQTCKTCLTAWWTATLDNYYYPVLVCPDCPESLIGNNEVDLLGLNMLARDIERYSEIKQRIKDCSNPNLYGASQEEYQLAAQNQLDAQDHIEENMQSAEYIKTLLVAESIKKCPNCACMIESFGHATRATCTRCRHNFPWRIAPVANAEQAVAGAGAGGGRHITLRDDAVAHRLFDPLSTELGPEISGNAARAPNPAK